MKIPSRRRLASVLVASALVPTLGGCSTPDLDAVTAERAYGPVLQDIADATAGVLQVDWSSDASGALQPRTSGCTWFSPTLKGEPAVPGPIPWDEVVSATNAVLVKYQFDRAEGADLKGGYLGIEASDSHEATMYLSEKSGAVLFIAVKVTDDC